MTSVLWEIVLPLFVAFVVGWAVMGWLTWRWRRAGVSKLRWAEVNDELGSTRSRLEQAEARVAELQTARPEPGPADGHSGVPEPAPIDDLKAIRGIGAKMEAKLHELGITSLRQIAAFDEAEIERVSAGIAFPGRIARDRWVAQAEELAARLPEDVETPV